MGFNSGLKGLNTAQHVSDILTPIIRSSTTAVVASGLPLERGGSSVVGHGRSGCPTGQEDARNMLSSILTTSNKTERLMHLVG
jgi:hypothetical protein